MPLDWWRYLVAQTVSLIGGQIWLVAATWEAAERSGPGGVALVLSAALAPQALLLVLGGTLVDRGDLRRLMLAADILRAGLMVIVALAVIQWATSLIPLVLAGIALGTVDALYLPASAAAISRLVPQALAPRAAGLAAAATRTAVAVGAPLGGIAVATGGLAAAALLNAVSYVAVAAAIRASTLREATSTPAIVATSLRCDLVTGLRYVTSNPLLRSIVAATMAFNATLAAVINIGLPSLVEERHWGTGVSGLLLMFYGIGATVSGAILMKKPLPRWAGKAIIVLMLFISLIYPTVGAAPSRQFAAVAVSLIGLAGTTASALLMALIQANLQDSLRGRAFSLIRLATVAAVPLTYFLFGSVASSGGVAVAVALAALFQLAAGALLLRVTALRNATLPL
jgi:predicted MFS family arabinose efflux permease